jgi:polar amino acid transport system substrate-binding protein
MIRLKALLAGCAMVLVIAGTAFAQEPPAVGASPRVDAIRKAGVLRVGQ